MNIAPFGQMRMLKKEVLVKVTCGGMLFIHALLVAWMGWSMSPNKIEAAHMASTVYQWHTFHFDLFHVNPPLTRVVSGLPILACQPNCDWDNYSSRPQDRSEWRLGRAFLKANSPQKVHWCFTLARWFLMPLLLVGGYFGYCLNRGIYGNTAGLLFLVVWCFSPFLLSWGGTICPDAAAASLGIVAVYTFLRWLHKPDWANAAIAGGCLGLLPLTKLTWIIAFGLWPAMWCLWMIPLWFKKEKADSFLKPFLHQLVVILAIGFYVLNMGYLFDGTGRSLGKYVFTSQMFRGPDVLEDPSDVNVSTNRFTDIWIGKIPVPLPAEFVQGIDTQKYDFERGLPSYVRGQHADHGWWYYYLYALIVKMPLGTWGLLGLAVICTVFLKGYNAPRRDEMVILLPGLALFIFVSSQTGFSVHSRYIIPALPFLFIWISKVGHAFTKEQLALYPRSTKIVRGLTVFFLGWMVISSLWIYPHSLSYFNELAAALPTPGDKNYPEQIVKKADASGSLFMALLKKLDAFFTAGPKKGPRHLLDSNIDWGQDLFYLEDWYEAHPESRPFRVAYCGSYPLELSKIDSAGNPPVGTDLEEVHKNTDLMTVGPLPGYYALSVNEIYGRSKQYRYFLYFEPVAMAGYSIYVYHITLDEANLVREKLGLPMLPKDWLVAGQQ